MTPRTDAELLAEYASKGDSDAFGEIVARHGAFVHRTCLRILRDAHEAEDACQTVFLVLAKKARGLRRGELSAWLYRVGHLVAAEMVRKRMRRAQREERYALDNVVAEETSMDDNTRQAVLEAVDAELMALPDRNREAVLMRYLRGYSQEDAAQHVGCSVATVAMRASRGIQRVRERLAKRGIVLGATALTAALASEAHAALPEALLSSTLTAVKAYAAGGAATAAVSSNVAALAKGVLNVMFWNTVKTAAVVTVAVTLVGSAGVGTILLATGRPGERAAPPAGPTQVVNAMEFANDLNDGDVVCRNIRVTPRDDKTATITADLSWGPSWRTDENHIAAWVFFKVRAEGSREWQHVRLAAGRVLNPTGYGCAQSNVKMDFLVPSGEDGFTGMLIRQGSLGELRSVNMKDVTVVWDLTGTPGLTKNAKVQVCAFGLVMVYVSQGPYCLGSGGTEPCGFYQYTDGKQEAHPYRVTGAGPIPTGTRNGRLWARGAEPADGGEIPATFPNGYGAFYCAYYPLSGSQYAHFLNLLSPEQAAEHYREPQEEPTPGTKSSRQTPRAGDIWRSGTAPNYTYTYERYRSDNRPSQVGTRWLSWADAAAYLAWAGLRPMTELEYEKALRGPRDPAPGETDHSYWSLPTGSDKSRWPHERAVTAAAIQGWSPDTFRGTHGLGVAMPPADWPQANAVGIGFRGGHADGKDEDSLGGPEFSRTSNRSAAALADPEPRFEFGIRAVRTAPEG